jgi:signal peptidase I
MFKDLAQELVAGLLLKKGPPPLDESRLGVLRRNLEGYGTAIAFALLIKSFAIDTFQVPTESMEPAIIGRGGMGDRILVDRLDYLARDPERYDIVVFKYPLSRLVNYVKRAVGLPGERIVIWRGQIFAAKDHGAELRCTRKPESVQESIFAVNTVLPPEECGDFTSTSFFKNWQANGFTPSWREGAVKVEAPAGQERLFENKFKVTNARTDRFAADAVGKGGGTEQCGDVRFEVEVTPAAGASAVLLDLRDPSNSGRALSLDLAVEGGAAASKLLFGNEDWTDAALAAVKLKAGKSTRVRFDNVDQTAVVTIDGDVVLRREYDVKPQSNVGLGEAMRLRAGVRSGAAEFARLAVFRDLYYSEYPGAPTEFFVPKDSYLMFGDNSPNSLDARAWRKAAIKIHGEAAVRYGDAEAVSEQVNNQRRMRNPFTKDDGEDYFLDVQGNEIRLEPGKWDLVDAATGEVRAAAVKSVADLVDPEAYRAFDHYVPREYVLGRAKFVFFPVTRIGVLR